MKSLKAFLLGTIEFRRSFTTHYADPEAARCYDAGREAAHRLTLSHYEE